MIYAHGKITPLPLPAGFRDSEPVAINDAGQVAGTLGPQSDHPQAFVYANGTSTNIGALAGVASSEAKGINARGWVVGHMAIPEGDTTSGRGFLFRDGIVTELGRLDSAGGDSSALGVNEQGIVVGESSLAPVDAPFVWSHGFVWSGGVMQDINDLISPDYGLTIWVCLAINDWGVITAADGDERHDGPNDVYLLWPMKQGAGVPRLRVKSKRVVVHSKRATITGKAIGAVSVTYSPAEAPQRVSFAYGAKNWSLKLSLEKGMPEVLTLVAHGVGGDSKPLTVTVIRK